METLLCCLVAGALGGAVGWLAHARKCNCENC